MNEKTLLITGFDPFGGESVNPSWLAVSKLPDTIGNYTVHKMGIPTVFGKAAEKVLEKANEIQPDLILCIGQAGGRDAVTPERIAVNIRDARIADNAGNQPRGEFVVPDGPAAYFATVPVTRMAEAIRNAHIPATVSNSAGAFGITIAEHIMMVTLMLLRQMPAFQQVVADRRWVRSMPMRSICGSTITVLGTGDIGTNFARRAKALGAKAVYGVRRGKKAGDGAFDAMYAMDELNAILPQTDILVMALPATAETVGVLSRERIALLPRHAIVVNVGRGSAVDQDALIDALNSEAIAGAALDVAVPEPLPQDHFLWDAPNLLLTPHVSGNMSLAKTCQLVIDIFLRNLEHWTKGEPLEHVVDIGQGY